MENADIQYGALFFYLYKYSAEQFTGEMELQYAIVNFSAVC
jgi:hypothetical protein